MPRDLRRLTLALLVALGMAPGTWLRAEPRSLTEADARRIEITRLDVAPRTVGELRLLAAWQISSRSLQFGGYSALLAPGPGRLLAASDRGRVLFLSGVEGERPGAAMDYLAGRIAGSKRQSDVESMTRDPVTGRMWVGYENSNQIERFDADFGNGRVVAPAAMAGWGANSGPEAMVRLGDGRFIVLAERDPSYGGASSPALLFPGDPVEGAEPLRFRFAPPPGYSPTDIAELPDGRVMILLRSLVWPVPARFAIKLVVADPAQITGDAPWRGDVVAQLAAPVPIDNFEGLAVEPAAGGGATLWLISDDNTAAQRTLLLKFHWPDTKKAPG